MGERFKIVSNEGDRLILVKSSAAPFFHTFKALSGEYQLTDPDYNGKDDIIKVVSYTLAASGAYAPVEMFATKKIDRNYSLPPLMKIYCATQGAIWAPLPIAHYKVINDALKLKERQEPRFSFTLNSTSEGAEGLVWYGTFKFLPYFIVVDLNLTFKLAAYLKKSPSGVYYGINETIGDTPKEPIKDPQYTVLLPYSVPQINLTPAEIQELLKWAEGEGFRKLEVNNAVCVYFNPANLPAVIYFTKRVDPRSWLTEPGSYAFYTDNTVLTYTLEVQRPDEAAQICAFHVFPEALYSKVEKIMEDMGANYYVKGKPLGSSSLVMISLKDVVALSVIHHRTAEFSDYYVEFHTPAFIEGTTFEGTGWAKVMDKIELED